MVSEKHKISRKGFLLAIIFGPIFGLAITFIVMAFLGEVFPNYYEDSLAFSLLGVPLSYLAARIIYVNQLLNPYFFRYLIYLNAYISFKNKREKYIILSNTHQDFVGKFTLLIDALNLAFIISFGSNFILSFILIGIFGNETFLVLFIFTLPLMILLTWLFYIKLLKNPYLFLIKRLTRSLF